MVIANIQSCSTILSMVKHRDSHGKMSYRPIELWNCTRFIITNNQDARWTQMDLREPLVGNDLLLEVCISIHVHATFFINAVCSSQLVAKCKQPCTCIIRLYVYISNYHMYIQFVLFQCCLYSCTCNDEKALSAKRVCNVCVRESLKGMCYWNATYNGKYMYAKMILGERWRLKRK